VISAFVVLRAIIALVTEATRRTVEDLLAAARRRIERLQPAEALDAVAGGAQLIDIRSGDARDRDGAIPGSLHIPRTVLEWRVDPASEWRNPAVGGLETQLVLICEHGYSSSLAAATLVELGFARAGDVIGGFSAWQRAGLPVTQAGPPRGDVLPGMAPALDMSPESV
jgi:rhodanese-related sulfurtransferase